MRKLIRSVAVGVSLAVSVLTAPQAFAQDARTPERQITGTDVRLSPNGARDAQTRAIAESDPATVSATATLCGTGYELEFAEQLPDSRRYGTLFTYVKSSVGNFGVCALFDNNTSSAKHMKLKLCPNKAGAACPTDEGTYSQYAGPVKYENSNGLYVMCSPVTAIMWDASGKAIIDRVRSATLCD